MLEPISQKLPEDVKASLMPISGLDIHYVAIRRALKSQSTRLAVELKKAKAEQVAKGVQTQTESHKEMLTNLQSARELKIAKKTALETELKNLSAEIEADEKKIAELPGLREKTQEGAPEDAKPMEKLLQLSLLTKMSVSFSSSSSKASLILFGSLILTMTI
jgi:uncharacterized membrane protein